MGGSPCAVETSSSGSRDVVDLVSVALGGSVSFGRFMSESLDWGRWSSFHHNRYLEDVEKYSVPGSVAQKRAYFEAHYKKKAPKLAVATDEDANSVPHSDRGSETDNGVSEDADSVQHLDAKDESKRSGVEVATDEEDRIRVMGASSEPNTNSSTLDDMSYELDTRNAEDDLIAEDKTLGSSLLVLESFESAKVVEDVENRCRVVEMEVDRAMPSDKLPLKESCVANQKNGGSNMEKLRTPLSKSPTVHRTSRLPPSPAKPVPYMRCVKVKENKSPQILKIYGPGSNDKKKATPNSLHMSFNFVQSQNGARTPPISKTSSVSEKIKAFNNSTRASHDCPKPCRTPPSKSSRDRAHSLKRPTPKLSQVCPHPPKTPMSKSTQDGDHHSKTSISMGPLQCSHPLKTPKTASSSGACKSVSATIQSESGRAKKLSYQTQSGRREMNENLHSLSADSKESKPSSIKESGAHTQIMSPSVSFRVDERVEKRKELFCKFKDSLDAEGATKFQFQGTGMADTGFMKLRQSLCYKARPMPDFYSMIEPTKNKVKKVPLIRPRSPKLGRGSTIATNTSSPPPHISSSKHGGSRHFAENRSQTPCHHVTSCTTR